MKLGDIVTFKNNDEWKKYYKGNYEVGFVTNGGNIKLQHIRTKERLPYNFPVNTLKMVRRGKY